MIVSFLPANKTYQVQKEDILLNIALKANIMIDGNCGGKGKCGKCKVQIVSGTIPEPDFTEKSLLTKKEIGEGYRLACRLLVKDDLTVKVLQTGNSISRKTKLTWMPGFLDETKHIGKYYLEIEEATLKNQENDIKRIKRALPEEDYSIDPLLMAEIPYVLKENNLCITVTVKDSKIISVEKGDTTDHCYGIAFDIGTTTVVGMLWDLNKGKLMGTSALTNSQSVFGADVISRIHFVGNDPDNLRLMKTKITECFNDIIQDFLYRFNIQRTHIYEATVVGNTTMSHLFLGVEPGCLARSPFSPVFCTHVDVSGKETEISINPQGNIHLLPNIASHVGSDTTGLLLASGIAELEGINLAIDVGTNGEIILAGKSRILACSTAAGPAFEGASVYQGMRAAPGAVEGVSINDGEVELKVIEDKEPTGICGSGLIDAVSELLNKGIIDYTGKLINKEAGLEKGIKPSLAERLRAGPKGKGFILAWGKGKGDILLTQKDIREVQLAKGAIYGGILIMMKELGVKIDDIDKIFLAGAFGNYIKKESALRIGLFPEVFPDKIISIGNAAGIGASMALLSKSEREKARIQAQKVEHIELSGHSDFQAEYINAMNFPKF